MHPFRREAVVTLPERAAPVPTHMFDGWGFHRILPAQRIRVPASPTPLARSLSLLAQARGVAVPLAGGTPGHGSERP
jgi:hypothetical protein